MYDPNKPIWTATFAEIEEFFTKLGITGVGIAGVESKSETCLRGVKQLADTLHLGLTKTMQLKRKGIFKDAVWQECPNGALLFNPDLAVKYYNEYCTSK